MYWREGGIGGEGTGYLRQEAGIGVEGSGRYWTEGEKVCISRKKRVLEERQSLEERGYWKLGDEFRREGTGRGGAKGNIGGIKSALCLEGVLY